MGWCLTTKLPLRDRQDRVIGLVGVSQDLRLPEVEATEFPQVADVVAFAQKNLAPTPAVDKLAAMANLSRYQLDRRIRRVFGLTTGQWLQKIKIDHAQGLLSESDQSIASIASQSGYADQSAFSRQFRQATGMTPKQFRLARRLKTPEYDEDQEP